MNTPKDFYVAGIGASAGGLEAIEAFFTKVPVDSGLAFVIVQHLSPDYISLMPEILLKRTSLPVHTAEDGMVVEPNNIYLIPRKMNMKIFHSKLHLTEKNNLHILNLPIDIFLHSLAEDFEDKAIGIILSGTGSDGSRGIRAIKENGGIIIVQDPDTSKFDGMPKSAITTGTVDYILAPQDIPEKITSYVKHPFIKDVVKVSDFSSVPGDYLTKIILLLKESFGLDFTYYKDATISRRIERRLSINQIEDLKQYLDYLNSSKIEQKTLYKELLIGVTKFFRDTEAFTVLENEIIPEIFKGKTKGDEVRVWITPCSTGEEAYSIAILFKEYMLENEIENDIKIFATDVDKTAVEQASTGIYNASITADVSTERLNRFFHQVGESYRIHETIREMIVFAPHNVIKDPPFNKIDLLSCRNLLIYFQTALQQKVLSLFNFALNKNGVLFLGSSESIGEMEHYFDIVDLKWKLFKTKRASRLSLETVSQKFMVGLASQISQKRKPTYFVRNTIPDLINIFTEKLLEDNTPDTVIVNENCEIVNSFGDPNKYLVFPRTKKISEGFEYFVTKMVPSNLKLTFSISISKALKSQTEIIHHNVKFNKSDSETYILDLKFVPLTHADSNSQFVVIYFIKKELPLQSAMEVNSFEDVDKQALQRIYDLENELKHSKENLQASIEELETTNEELQSTNEELISSNEELQSTNEELQSVNEELYTVNTEFQAKNHDLTVMNNDMENLLQNADIRIIFLDNELKIRKFTDNITDIFNLRKNDHNRPISDITHHIPDNDLFSKAEQVASKQMEIREIVQVKGRFYQMKILPYITQKGFSDGVVITFIDITDFYNTEQELKKSEEKLKMLFDFLPVGISIADYDGKLISANHTAEKLLGISREDQLKRTIDGHEWKIVRKDGSPMPPDEFASMRAMKENRVIENVEMGIVKKGGDTTWIVVNASPTNIRGFDFAISYLDITERINNEISLRESEERFRTAFENSAFGFALVAEKGRFLKVNKNYADFLAYNEIEILNLNIFDVTHPDDYQVGLQLTKQLYNKEISNIKQQKRYIRKDKKIVWGLVAASAVFDRNKVFQYYISQVQDITQEIEIENQNKFHQLASQTIAKINEVAIHSSIDIHSFSRLIFNELQSVIGCAGGFVSIANSKTKKIEKLISTDNVKHCMDRNDCHELPDDNKGLPCFCGFSLLTRKSFFTNNRKEFLKINGLNERSVVWDNFLSVPVITNQELVGQIALANKPADFSDNDLQLVQNIAGKLAIVILRLKINAELVESKNLYHSIFENMASGFALFEIVNDKHEKSSEYRLVDANKSLINLLRAGDIQLAEQKMKHLFESNAHFEVSNIYKMAQNGQSEKFILELDNFGVRLKINIFSHKPGLFAVMVEEVSS